MTHILVVDDDPVMRAVIGVMLTRLGHDVVDAQDLASANQAVNDHDFDAIVCDYLLPDGSGLDLLEAHAQLAPRFILLTGTRERDDLGDDRVGGVAGYLTKPVGSDALADCLNAVLSPVASETASR